MLFAAAIHDLEHTGTNNQFHITSKSELALLYNDQSVLENHHISTAFRIMRDSDKNITQNLDDNQWREFRSNVIGTEQLNTYFFIYSIYRYHDKKKYL